MARHDMISTPGLEATFMQTSGTEAVPPLGGCKPHDLHNSAGYDVSAISGIEFNRRFKIYISLFTVLVQLWEWMLISFKSMGIDFNTII